MHVDFEPDLVDWIIQREKAQRPAYWCDIIAECQRFIDWMEIPIPSKKRPWEPWKPTEEWKEAFLRRAAERGKPIAPKTAAPFDHKRAAQECVPVVDKYFEDLKEVLDFGGYDKTPWNIYGMDETQLKMKVNKGKPVGRKGQHVADKAANSAALTHHVTLVPFVRAAPHPAIPGDSQWLPPVVVVADPGMERAHTGIWRA